MYEDTALSRADLAEQMRAISLENDYVMGRRRANDSAAEEGEPEESLQRIFAKARLLLALILVGAVIFMDRRGQKLGALDAEKIYHTLALDYEQFVTEKVLSLMENSRLP